MEIYLILPEKINIEVKKKIILSDLCDYICYPKDNMKILSNLVVYLINENKNKTILITITDVIKVIKQEFPDAVINNLGGISSVIYYENKRQKKNVLIDFAKIFFICSSLTAGSATAIMTFHNESQMNIIFQNFYEIFFDKFVKDPLIIQIPYSIGLTMGIIVFFNHFAGKKITNDPTPIEIEITKYESDLDKTIADILTVERSKEGID